MAYLKDVSMEAQNAIGEGLAYLAPPPNQHTRRNIDLMLNQLSL